MLMSPTSFGSLVSVFPPLEIGRFDQLGAMKIGKSEQVAHKKLTAEFK
jgi:hypothetical protein